MTRETIYTDPYLGTEVLLIQRGDRTFGVAYDPRKTVLPVPWSSDCPHCLAGRFKEISPHLRREIVMLLSQRAGESCVRYRVPTNGHPLTLYYWARGKTHHARITRSRQRLRITRRPGNPRLEYVGDPHLFQSPILHRCLRFLFSARKATPREITACLRPMLEQQLLRARQPRTRGGRRLSCREIDWSTTLDRIP
jgi:hypothetical protein